MLSPTPIDRPSLHPGTYLIAPRVPHGLAAVVEGLTREVLRHRPEDIYVFAAHHFEKLLKLREQYYAEEYNDREFDREFSRDFNLSPTKETEDTKKVSHSDWSLKKEIGSLEKRGNKYADAEETTEDGFTDRENRKTSTSSKVSSRETKRTSKRSKNNETSDARAARIISQMSAAKSIQTKDIKQELRKNKLSGEKTKITDNTEKGIKGERRGNRTKVVKADKVSEEETERSTTITSSSKTSTRRPLKKVRRIETESETETEREINKTRLENGHSKSIAKNDRKAKEKRISSEHSCERKISSRAISMDRIRAYVLRKFASTASLEVLRSPTYVEQVQEVIDRAAPIIKEKLEEIRRPRGKRSRSVDLAWNEESLRQYARDEKRRGDREKEKNKRGKSENGLERREDVANNEENCFARKESISSAETEEKKIRTRSVGSGKKSRRRESGDFGVVDQVDNNSRHSDHKSDNVSPNVSCDTLEARLTVTQNILEDISKTTSELSGARKIESSGSAPSPELEISDANIVSLPIVRPPSSKNSRNASKTDSDNLTLPPISPEVPKSTKKKDELSLPILPAATNGNHSKKSQEDDSKDVEEASTMRDITSDMEDEGVNVKKDLNDDRHDVTMSDVRITNEEKREEEDEVLLREDISETLAEKQGSFEELEKLIELEGDRLEENFKDSLNVTPEVDVPPRPDSLESPEMEKLRDDDADIAQNKTFDGLKDKLIEIEMAERNVEKALAGQSTATRETDESSKEEETTKKDDVKDENKESMRETEQAKEEETETSTNEMDKVENLTNRMEEAIKQAEKSAKLAEEVNDVEEAEVLRDRESVNPESPSGDGQMIADVITDDGNSTTSQNKPENETNESSGTATSENPTDEASTINLSNGSNTGKKKERKKREAGKKSPATTALSLDIPFAYVLSEGSPCEIPESVTTVIIPDRRYSSPVIAEEDDNQQKEHSLVLSDVENKTQDQEELDANLFGEYIPAEPSVSSVDIEFAQDLTGMKPNQDIVILHQDLDKIKEEGEEEEKEDVDEKEMTNSPKEEDDDEAVTRNEEATKMENIAEREENEDIGTKTIPEQKDTEEASSDIPEDQSLPDIMQFVTDTDLINEERTDTVAESKSTPENSSEESGSTRDTRTSSEVKEGLASTRSAETPSLPIPLVPELNLDSLQDNTVSSFKISASETKEDNGSPRESDATSLIEPLTSDERLMNRLALTEHDEEVEEEVTGRDLRSELPEADQLYRAEHAEYVWLEKDSMSSETILEDEAKSQEDSTGLKTLPEDVVHVGPLLRGDENDEELNSEEEIARELIGSLDEEILRADEFNSKPEDSGELEKSDLSANEKSNQPPSEFVQSVSADEPKKIEHEVSSETMKTDEDVARGGEELSVLTSHATDISDDKDIPITNKEHEESELEVKEKETEQVAPLAQFEPDELLEENDKGDKITIEDVPDIDNLIDNREKSEDGQTSIEEIADTSEITSKNDEELNKNQEENEQEKLQDQENSMQEELQVDEERERENVKLHEEDDEEKLKLQEEIANEEKLQDRENSMQEKSQVDEEREQENVKLHEEDDEEKLKLQEEIANEEKLQDQENNMQEELQVDEEREQENVKLHEEDDEEKLKLQEEIANEEKLQDQENNMQEELQVDEERERENVKLHEEEDDEEKLKLQEEIANEETLQDRENSTQEELQVDKDRERENVKLHEEEDDEEKLKLQEEIANGEKLQDRENSMQEELQVDEEHERENVKLHEEDDEEKLIKSQEEIGNEEEMAEVTESRKDSTNESIKDGEEHEIKQISRDECVTEKKEEDVEDKTDEKVTNTLPGEVEIVHGPITSAITEESVEDPHDGHWTMRTKSSTVETTIETDGPNTSADENMKAVDDEPEITESLSQKKDDFYSAVVKIQACVRGFLARRQKRKDLESELLSTQKTITDSSNLQEGKSGRRLRREIALRNTTLSLENAFATGRLQHTGEFHDSVPLPLFDITNSETSSIQSNESSIKEVEEDTEEAKQSSTDQSSDCVNAHEFEQGENFQKNKDFADYPFPIMMQLLTDASRRFTVSQNSHSDFNANVGGTKMMEPTVDIVMLGYPRNEDNQYLNFITSVEDLGSNMNSLSQEDAAKYTKDAGDDHPSMTSGEGSIREPLAIPGARQGVVIEEVTSLEAEVPSESTKSSTVPKTTSLDTNSSVPLEECEVKDEKSESKTASKVLDASTDRKSSDDGVERQTSDSKSQEEKDQVDLNSEDGDKKSDKIVCGNNHESVDEEKNEEK